MTFAVTIDSRDFGTWECEVECSTAWEAAKEAEIAFSETEGEGDTITGLYVEPRT